VRPDNPSFRTSEDWEKMCERHVERIKELEAKLVEAVEVIEFYGNKNTYKDLWELNGEKSDYFKYFEVFRSRHKDTENLSDDGKYHFYAGKRARAWMMVHKKSTSQLEEDI
jgi:hypothetical protein